MTAADDPPADGRITAERLDRIFAIGIDRPKKLNGFSPKMLIELAEAFTAFERDEAAWVGLLYAHGANFTAGLELDKVAPFMRERGSVFPMGSIDPLSLRPPIRTKPLVCAVQGICFTLGIELMLAADIVIAAEDCRFAQIEVKRGIMPAGGATVRMVERAGWGNAQRYLLTGDELGATEALRLGSCWGGAAGTQGSRRRWRSSRAGAARLALARLFARSRRSRPARRDPRVQRPAGPPDGDGGRRGGRALVRGTAQRPVRGAVTRQAACASTT
jgi:enoyl-CoA hydratase/carnithine racemase